MGFTQCFGMLGGFAGQFSVGPIIHGTIPWQNFWFIAAGCLFVITVLVIGSSWWSSPPMKNGFVPWMLGI
jgi:hypothetical protein